MSKAVRAVYEGGVFKPQEPVHLDERTEVEVLIPTAAPPDEDDPTGWKTADALIGCIEGGLKESVGEEHDRHLYKR